MFNTAHFHPMIVHFPIALITVGFVADIASLFFRNEKCLSKTGFYLMVLGALAAIAAWLTGKFFTSEPTEGAIVQIFNNHKTGALITMIIMIVGSVFRIWLVMNKREQTQLKWIAFGLYFFALVAVTLTGLWGGTMVYNFMMGL
jgi:uncharacterized membrane protein